MGIKKLINEKIVLKCYKNKPNSVYATVLKKNKIYTAHRNFHRVMNNYSKNRI